jgi:biopolymer transport protein ExbD
MLRFLRKKQEEETILLTPFVDIVLNLLIFFAVTTQFDIASGVHIRLPAVAHIIKEQQENRIVVIIDASGQIYLEGKKLDPKMLGERLKTLVKEKRSVQLVLQADKDVKHGIVVQAMDIAKSAGVQSIVIAAQWKVDKVM